LTVITAFFLKTAKTANVVLFLLKLTGFVAAKLFLHSRPVKRLAVGQIFLLLFLNKQTLRNKSHLTRFIYKRLEEYVIDCYL
jgi:hypothetical protein